MHLKFEGGKLTVKGNSEHTKHKGEVPILAWSWGASNTGDLHSGDGFATGGKANVNDITVTKYVDNCSHALLKGTCSGDRAEKCTLTVANAVGEQEDFVTLKLSEGVMIKSVSTGGSAGDERLIEHITLHFGAFDFEFAGQDDKGNSQGKPNFGFNMRQVKGQGGA
jgi:type VI secretion system secreted protein Hcp